MKKSMEIIGNEQKNDGYFLVYSSWIVLVDKKEQKNSFRVRFFIFLAFILYCLMR